MDLCSGDICRSVPQFLDSRENFATSAGSTEAARPGGKWFACQDQPVSVGRVVMKRAKRQGARSSGMVLAFGRPP